MKAKAILDLINFGSSVAEFDNDLDKHFIETETFRSVVNGKGDIIAGDKGTGKTAIYRILKKNYRSYDVLNNVEIIDAFNPQGDPIFQRLANGPSLTEDQLRTFWKAYIFSLVGNWILSIYPHDYSDPIKKLSDTLIHLGLEATDVSPETIFGKLHRLVEKMLNPAAIEAEFSITEAGMPVLTPRVEFGNDIDKGTIIYNGDYLKILDEAVRSTDLEIWVLFDRLDEAFAGNSKVEIPALRALLRSYLDLTSVTAIKPKLFLRKDLFRRVIKGGFVNLTHINARRIEIIWDDEDLWSMVTRRLRSSKEFMAALGDPQTEDSKLLSILLPEQIDVGDRKPTTDKWIMNRIRDGNNNRPPRNMIDLLNKSREAQIRREQREARDISEDIGPILEADSVKRAFRQLSEQRVQDTLLAEAEELIPMIEAFRDGKSEHNAETLRATIGTVENFATVLQSLVDIGFLEEFGSNHKIPMLYRDGLKVRQGKAFSPHDSTDESSGGEE